jgi:serine phosphatase RsbU (regulator of sigma subunit)
VIRAVLVDDEPPARVRMKQLLAAAGDVTVVGEAGSAVEAREVIRNTHPDLLFLDVEMPEVRGTALAASLPEPRPFIVFATAFDQYALDAIALDATDYLLKPVSRIKLAATLDRVRARLARQTVDKDIVAASDVQAHMWPVSLPLIPGFDCAAASLPARGVGGDFYDLFPLSARRGGTFLSADLSADLSAEARSAKVEARSAKVEVPPDSWALLLGDASGKGIAAGLVASAVQARVHTAATLAHLGPEALMAAVDEDVHATTDGARYATAIYGVLDASQHRLTLVNAGHPSVLVWPPGAGEPLRLDATGPALGLIKSGLFRSHGVPLDSGSVLVAVTDGVYDALNQEGAEFGDSKLADVLRDLRHRSATDLCRAILDAVREHRGSRQDQDDATAMVVKAR